MLQPGQIATVVSPLGISWHHDGHLLGSHKKWRLLCSAVINRYGFNSDGVDAVAANMAAFRRREAAGSGLGLGSSQTPAAPADAAAPSGRVGVNLGKNKARPLGRRELCCFSRVGSGFRSNQKPCCSQLLFSRHASMTGVSP